MYITSTISNVHDGDNKRAYSIFHPLCVSSKENVAEATEMICPAYGKNVVSHIKRWYQKFHQGDFSLEDDEGCWTPSKD